MNKVLMSILVVVLSLSAVACSHVQPRGEQMFPQMNTDPSLGLIINKGSCNLNLIVRDKESGQLVQKIYVPGISTVVKIRDEYQPVYTRNRLSPGCYKVEVTAFYLRRIVWSKETVVVYNGEQELCVPEGDPEIFWKGENWGWKMEFTHNSPEGRDRVMGLTLTIK